MSFERFRRSVQNYTTLMLKVYNDLGGNTDTITANLSYLKDNRRERENPVRLDHLFVDATVYNWKEPIPSSEMWERVEWTVPMEGWGTSFFYDELELERPHRLLNIPDMVRQQPPAFIRKRVELLGKIFYKNPLAYDGADFFSNSHQHPLGRGTYSNHNLRVIDSNTATLEEAYDYVQAIRSQFIFNLAVRRSWTPLPKDATFTVVVPDWELAKIFEKVRDMAELPYNNASQGKFGNTLKGTFDVVWAGDAPSSQQNYIWAYWHAPGGPRATVWVPDKDPWMFVEEPGKTQRGKVQTGMKAIYAGKALFPQAGQRWDTQGGG